MKEQNKTWLLRSCQREVLKMKIGIKNESRRTKMTKLGLRITRKSMMKTLFKFSLLRKVTVTWIDRYRGGSAVINTAKKEELGKHWVVVWFDGAQTHYFDPAGHPPQRHGLTFDYHTTRRWQPIGTSTCGLYCLWFLWHISRKWTIYDLEKKYDAVENELLNTLIKLTCANLNIFI